jgi:hypothetical protein
MYNIDNFWIYQIKGLIQNDSIIIFIWNALIINKFLRRICSYY